MNHRWASYCIFLRKMKRYREYLYDETIKVPTSTRYHHLKKLKQEKSKQQTENQLKIDVYPRLTETEEQAGLEENLFDSHSNDHLISEPDSSSVVAIQNDRIEEDRQDVSIYFFN
jgi:hypothetical protein